MFHPFHALLHPFPLSGTLFIQPLQCRFFCESLGHKIWGLKNQKFKHKLKSLSFLKDLEKHIMFWVWVCFFYVWLVCLLGCFFRGWGFVCFGFFFLTVIRINIKSLRFYVISDYVSGQLKELSMPNNFRC